MKDQNKAYLYALTAVAFWSTVATVFKLTLRHLSSTELVLYASGFSALALFVVLLVQGKLGTVFAGSPMDYLRSAGLGFLSPFLYYTVLFKAYSLLPAQEAQPLNFTWPIVLVLFSAPLLGQKVTLKSLSAFLVSFAGVLVIATRGDLLGFRFSDPLGVSLAVGSSVVWAFYWIGNLKDQRGETVKLFLNFLFGFIFCLIAAALLGELRLPPWQGIVGSAYVGLFEMGLTFVFWLTALQLSSSAAKVAIFIYGIPFVSMVLIAIFVGETILLSSVLGAALIVGGIVIQRRVDRFKESSVR